MAKKNLIIKKLIFANVIEREFGAIALYEEVYTVSSRNFLAAHDLGAFKFLTVPQPNIYAVYFGFHDSRGEV